MLNPAPKHVLVPVDGSRTSSYAVAYAAMLQKTFGAKITLVHVYGFGTEELTTYTSSVRMVNENSEKDGREILEREKNHHFDVAAPVETLLIEGNVMNELIDFINTSDCDLVVIGSQGVGSPLRRFFVGSVARKVVTNVEKPVLVLRDPKISEDDA